jgi:nucleoside-diphosphate-sugar epimerase
VAQATELEQWERHKIRRFRLISPTAFNSSRGDDSDLEALPHALVGVHVVAHLAAESGTGQSMYEVVLYGRTNLMGSAVLYDLLRKSHMKYRGL